MKRVIIILLSICLFCCTYTCVFAETITEETTQQTNLAIEYAVESAYVVTIPDTITVNPSDAVHGTVDITISDVMLPKGYTVRVQLHGNSYSDGHFYLTDKNDPESQIPYAIVHDSLGAEMTPGAVVNMVEAGSGNRTETLNIQLLNEAIYAGAYADIVTFDVNLWVDGRPANITADNLYGTWKFNEHIDLAYFENGGEFCRGGFSANGMSYDDFLYFDTPPSIEYFAVSYGNDIVYHADSGWTNESFRVVDLGSNPRAVSSAFFEWLISNATYQSS